MDDNDYGVLACSILLLVAVDDAVLFNMRGKLCFHDV